MPQIEAKPPRHPTPDVWDRTQGPQASVGAGAAAITRVHAAFYQKGKSWRQTRRRQVELLHDLGEYYTVENGYVVQNGMERELPRSLEERDDLLDRCCVGLHSGVQVTFCGLDGETLHLLPPSQPPQIIDQVFCAAMNIAQGATGEHNLSLPGGVDKADFLLRAAYRGTYLAAIANKCTRLFLTLIGGGVFGNRLDKIYKTIREEHIKWTMSPTNTLTDVFIVHWSANGAEINTFVEDLVRSGVIFDWTMYANNTPTIRQAVRA